MAHVQPKEMPFCLARLMTIWVLSGTVVGETRRKNGMVYGDEAEPTTAHLQDRSTRTHAWHHWRLHPPLGDRSSSRRHLRAASTSAPSSWTLMSSVPNEERLLAGCRSFGAFLSRRRSLFAPALTLRLIHHLCTQALHRNVREYLLTAAVWRALRPGSPPFGAIDRDRPQQRPCFDIEAATSG